jgi:ketosteroid isomerase-like protein
MNTKRLLSITTLLLIAASLLLAACAPGSPAAPAKDLSDPLTLVTEYYTAIEASDIDKAMTFVSENYVMTDPSGFTVGKEAATAAWKGYIDTGLTFDQSDFKVDGNRVTSCYKVYEKGNLIDEGCGAVTHVRDGKIVFDGLEPAEQIWIVQQFYEIINTKDVEKAMSLTAEDYVMNDPFGTYDRAAAAEQWKAVVMDAGLSFNQTDFANTGNGRVTSCYEVFENGNSIDKGCGNVTHVRDGRIIFDGLEAAEQVWVVQKYYEALNAKNLDLAMSYIAPEALFINPTGTYEGAEAIRESLAGLNKDGITFDLSNFRNTDGTIVYDYEVLQAGNVLDKGTNGLTVVRDGKIIFDGTEETNPATALSDPATVAQSFYQALNEGNLDAAMQLVAEDIKCRGACYLSGKQSFQFYIQGSINMGGRVELSDLQVNGDSVTYIWTAYNTDGSEVALGEETMQIQNGQIILFETQLGTSP